MLRALVLLLILANAGVWAWYQGWLGPVIGLPAPTARESHRLQAEIHPDRLTVVGPQGDAPALPPPNDMAPPPAASAPPPSPGPMSVTPITATGPVCLEAGPFTPAEQGQVAALLGQRLPPGTWSTQAVDVMGLWMVYMGPYADAEALARKQSELARIRNLSFEEVRSPPSLAMGLSLGRYTQQAQAEGALESLRERGVRTARIITLRPPMSLTVVRVPQADAGRQRDLSTLPLPAGKGFTACRG